MRRTSLKILMPKLSSQDSLCNSPDPSSPGDDCSYLLKNLTIYNF